MLHPFCLGSVIPLRWSSLLGRTPHTPKRHYSHSAQTHGAALAALPPLRCPGGPRVKAEGLKHLFKVPHAGFLAKYDHRFILNLKLTHQIVSLLSRTALRTGDKVLVELGPGAGALTRSLLTRPCHGVLGVEGDARFNAHLEQIRAYTRGKFQWVNADVLRVNELDLLRAVYPRFVDKHARHPPMRDKREEAETRREGNERGRDETPFRSAKRERVLRQRLGRNAGCHPGTDHAPRMDAASVGVSDRWWSDGEAKVEVVANLPFDIITELLMRYAVDCARRANLFVFGRVPIHIFTQKEIADRIIAPAGSMHFSRLSVLCQCYFHVQMRQTFREMTYYPRTEVLGALLTLRPRSVPLVPALDASVLMHFTDLLMRPGNRGMTVHKALQRGVPPEVAQYMLQELRLDGAMTVLDLTVEEVCKLAVLWNRFLEASSQQPHGQQGKESASHTDKDTD